MTALLYALDTIAHNDAVFYLCYGLTLFAVPAYIAWLLVQLFGER